MVSNDEMCCRVGEEGAYLFCNYEYVFVFLCSFTAIIFEWLEDCYLLPSLIICVDIYYMSLGYQ